MISYTFYFFAFLYGILNILAGTLQLKQQQIHLISSASMIIGGTLILVSVYNLSFIVMIIGLLIIHITTIFNGLSMHGKINIKHHLIRLLFSIIIVVLLLQQ